MNNDFDQALKGLEKVVQDNQTAAEEGIKDIFKPKTAEELVAKQEKVIAKIKDAGKIDELLKQVEDASSTYNSIVKEMIDATKSCEAGEIDKKQLAAKIKELSKQAQDYGSMIKHGKLLPGKSGAKDEDLQFLKTYLEGVKKALNDRKTELTSGGDEAEEGCKGKASCEGKCGGKKKGRSACESDIDVDEFDDGTPWTAEETAFYNETLAQLAQEALFDDEDEVAEEAIGSTKEVKSIYKNSMKAAKAGIKEVKKLKKSGDIAGAKSKIDEIITNLQNAKKDIYEVSKDDTKLGVYFANYAESNRVFAKMMLLLIPTLGVGTVVTYVKTIVSEIDLLITNSKKKKAGEKLTPADRNFYRKSLGELIDKEIKVLNKIKTGMDKGENSTSSDAEKQAAAEEGILKKIKEHRAAKKAKKEGAGEPVDEPSCESIYDITEEELTALETLGLAEEGVIKNIKEKIKAKKDSKALIKELKSIAEAIDSKVTVSSKKYFGGIGYVDFEDMDDDANKSKIISALKEKCNLEKDEKDDNIYTITTKGGEAEEGCKSTESVQWSQVTDALESMLITDEENISLGLESMVK